MPKSRTKTWISGTVVPGDKKGRTLGFPTANLKLAIPSQRPAAGIYAVWAREAQKETNIPGVMHIGPRPTYNKEEIVVEIHLINFPDRSLYGTELVFQVVKRLRSIKKFTSEKSLIEAMNDDRQKALEVLS